MAAEPSSRPARGGLLVTGAVVALAALSLASLDIDWSRLGSSLSRLPFLTRQAFPPDASVVSIAWIGIRETLAIAFLGTLGGLLLSLPLGMVASRNLFPGSISAPARLLLAWVRVFPSLLWALVFVILVGLGPLAGVLATILYTAGYLGKLQYEAFEGLSREPFEALSAIGASRLQLLRFVVLPEGANAILSQALFLFEYNVRASSILGFVGAGGIGFYLSAYLRFFEYDKVLTLLIVIFIVVVVIDEVSRRVRERFLDAPVGHRARGWLRARVGA